MKREEWQIEKPRLLTAVGRMETWTEILLQSVQDAKAVVETANDDSMFQAELHPVGVPAFEMFMRDIDSPLREILAVHQAIQEHSHENQPSLNTGKLLEKPDFTSEEVSEVLALVQSSMAEGKTGESPIVCVITNDKIELQVEPDK